MEEPGRLQTMGSQRVRHDLATKPRPPMANMQPGTFGLSHEQVLLYSFLRNISVHFQVHCKMIWCL